MFVLTAKFKVIKGKEKEFDKLLLKTAKAVLKNEKGTLMYEWHRKVGDPTEVFFYERYTDRPYWAEVHANQPYIKELVARLKDYTVGNLELTEYELVEVK